MTSQMFFEARKALVTVKRRKRRFSRLNPKYLRIVKHKMFETED